MGEERKHKKTKDKPKEEMYNDEINVKCVSE
jgi:hypothetical protein